MRFMLGGFTVALILEIGTRYHLVQKDWNDWWSIGLAIAGVCLFGLNLFFEAFDITKRSR